MAASPSLGDFTMGQCKQLDTRFVLPPAQPRQSISFRAPTAQLSGKYFVQWDDVGGNRPRAGYDAITRVRFTGDSAFIENFFGLDFTARGKYDAATSTIHMAPQPAFIEAPYGTFWLCPFDVQQGGFYSDPKSSFTIKVNDDGTMQGGQLGWVVVIKEPTSAFYGSALGMSREIRFRKTNATMSGNRRNIDALNFSSAEYPVYVEQISDDDVLIANIAMNGREVHMQLLPGKKWTMEPQVILEQSVGTSSGPACTFPAEWSSTKNKSKGINKNLTGDGDETMLEFGPWGVFRSNALLTCTFGMESSVLMLDEGLSLRWPSTVSNDLQGDGSETNPYKISTVDDLVRLARRVNGGEKFTGKYVQQTADINFADLKSRYYPVGSDATNCFDGTYDGNGKVIRNMNIERGSSQYSGLFGYVGANGHITGVNIVNGRISTSGKYNGLIAGYCLGRIDNVSTNGLINSTTEYNGGVAGYSCSVRDSRFIGQISGMASTGGITGELHWDTIANCHVSANIQSSIPNTIGHSVGGIAGSVYGSSSSGKGLVSGCYFLGSMTDNTGYAHQGCIAGTIGENASATRCIAVGVMTTNVTKSSIGSCGGLVGSLSGGGLSDCYSSTSIQGPKESTKVGGLIGLGSVSKSFKPEVRNCIATGQVRIQGIAAPELALHGTLSATSGVYPTFSNTFADAQVSGLDGEQGLLTSRLVSGTPLEGFDTGIWDFAAGRYPLPKGVAPANVAALATVPAVLNGSEKITNVKNDITLTLHPDLQWSLFENNQYLQETAGMKIEGNKARLKGILSQEFLMVSLADASLGGTFSRIYMLNVAPSQFEGAGTAEDPFLIKTPADMKVLNKAITANGLTFEGDYFALANDIDFNGVTDFYGVADDSKETHAFAGTFDGRGHSIRNWRMNGLTLGADGKIVNSGSRQTTALFGILGAKGTVRNIVIDSSCSLTGHSGIASTVAICYGTVENIRNYASVTAAGSYSAGIVARLCSGARMTDCYNAGTITVGSTYAAGIVAEMQAESSMANCQNDGLARNDSISANFKYSEGACAAGLVGNTGGAATITNCVNQGNVSAAREGAGIVARCASGTVIKNCVATGMVSVADITSTFGAVAATNLNKEGFSNLYYDGQLLYQGAVANGPMEGCNGLNSTELVSGNVLDGLSAEIFDFEAGKYPVLKAYKEEKAAKALRSMTVILGTGDVVNEISSPVTLGNSGVVKWSYDGTGMSLNGSTLTVVSTGRPGQGTLTASCDGFSRNVAMQTNFVPFQGAGTKADPYRLNTFADWKTLSEYTNTYGFRYEGRFFAMDNDVEFDSTFNFTPIAFNSINHFQGQIDGRNHRLNHVRIEWTDKTDKQGRYQNVGIISMLGRNGAVRNVTIGGRIRAYKYVGGLVGISYGVIDNCHNDAYVATTNNTNTGGLVSSASAGSITNCTNTGRVVGNYTYVGGIVSYTSAGVRVAGCTNYGTVIAKDSVKDTYYNTVGGIVGNAFGRVVNCVNRGTVMGSGSVGGVAAAAADIDSCVNYSDITVNGSMIGGVAGKTTSNGRMSHCYNYGRITGSNYTGGVLGDAGSGSAVSFCSNHAVVTGNSKAYTGGVVGDLSTNASIDSCANFGDIFGTGTNSTYVGGVTGGGTSKCYVRNSVNYGNISQKGANSYAAAGISAANGGEVSDCINYGSVSGESYGVGGIAGYGGGRAFRCVNLGNLSTTYAVSTKKYGNVGGIWGNGCYEIRDCINYGNVKGNHFVGGIQGYSTASTKISRVYFSGTLESTDAGTTGAIIHIESTHSKVVVDSAYYNKDVAFGFPTNERDSLHASGLGFTGLRVATLGDAFLQHEYALPTLKCFGNVTDLNVAATMLCFKPDEDANHFRTSAHVELFPGAEWSVTPNLRMDGSKIWVVSTKVLDPATITVKGPRYSRSFAVITDNGGTGADGIEGDKTPLKVTYYTVGGIEVQNPVSGTTVIERTVYTDGTSRTRKIIIR